MVHLSLESLFLYSAFAAPVILASPAHQHKALPSIRSGTCQADVPASASPVYGTILIYPFDGPGSPPLGFLSNTLSDWGSYALTTNWNTAITNAQLFSGALTNPAQLGGYSNIGFVAVDGTTLSLNSSQPAFMAGVAATPSGSRPVTSMENSLGKAPGHPHALESNLWSLTEYNELIPTWINPDGSSILADIGYGPDADNGIFITGNLTAFREDPELWNNLSTVQIRLFFANLFNCGPSNTPGQNGDDLPCPEHEHVAEV